MPQNKPGPKPITIEIFGEAKRLAEWAADPRCQVSLRWLRTKYQQGVRGPELLNRFSNRGRPKSSRK